VTRPKFGVRALMVLVAVVALGTWGEQMRRRRAYCLVMAEEHRGRIIMPSGRSFAGPARTEDEELRNRNPHAGLRGEHSLTEEDLEKLRKTDPHVAWHLSVRDADLRCASRPWEALPTEPTEPSDFSASPGQGRSP
jgi:hypothetical protein